jgi:hypothetical protein
MAHTNVRNHGRRHVLLWLIHLAQFPATDLLTTYEKKTPLLSEAKMKQGEAKVSARSE